MLEFWEKTYFKNIKNANTTPPTPANDTYIIKHYVIAILTMILPSFPPIL